jgi:hypothetical protein
MSNTHQDRDHKLYTEYIKKMLIDYVTNDFTPKQLSEKYKLTSQAVGTIIEKHKFREKRLQYQEKVLQKSVDKLATRHAFILSRITNILWKQVERLEKNMRDDPDRLLDSNRMKEVLTAFAILSKEHRLDTGQSTENQTHVVKVEFGSSVPIISDNHLQQEMDQPNIVEAQVVDKNLIEEQTKDIEEKSADISDDDLIFGSLDRE